MFGGCGDNRGLLMIKRLCLLFIAILGCFPSALYAQQAVGVVVLPFEVHAKAELSYLQQEIPKALSNQLEKEGARVLVLDEASLPSWKQQIENIEQLREIGLQTGAQYVLWGSLTWIGQQFSLDVKLISSGDNKKPALISKDGKGVENLPASVKEAVTDISLVIFKREKIVDVFIEGKAQPGDIYNQKSLSQDLKAVYAMGYFDDIRIEAQTKPDGKIVIFNVKEKPTVRSIRLKGDIQAYEEEELREILTVRTGSILNLYKINSDIARIKEMYNEKNFHNAQVDYKILPQKKNQADLEFVIDEGERTHVTKIRFEGNRAYSDDDLKDLMTTSEENIFSWFTDAGDLIYQNLSRDVAQIKAFYRNHGYIQARVGEPQIEYKEEGVEITINVVEGPQFKVGKVKISGDLILPEHQLLEKITIREEEYYNREALRNDVITIDDLYANEGYANVDVSPRIYQNEEELLVDIDIVIAKGKLVFFEEIIIGGNTKTRDKVIRRELRVYEQELFSADRLRRSIQNLQRLDFFEDVQVNTAAGSADDKKILKVDVTEKSTGTVQLPGPFNSALDTAMWKTFLVPPASRKETCLDAARPWHWTSSSGPKPPSTALDLSNRGCLIFP
jgi:outer membrane protein insertion porin family